MSCATPWLAARRAAIGESSLPDEGRLPGLTADCGAPLGRTAGARMGRGAADGLAPVPGAPEVEGAPEALGAASLGRGIEVTGASS